MIGISIVLWYTRNLEWRKGHIAGTPEQAWPAKLRFGLDFQIHKVEVRLSFLKALILTKGQAWGKSVPAITCDKKPKFKRSSKHWNKKKTYSKTKPQILTTFKTLRAILRLLISTKCLVWLLSEWWRYLLFLNLA